jgi:hypothetical protein
VVLLVVVALTTMLVVATVAERRAEGLVAVGEVEAVVVEAVIMAQGLGETVTQRDSQI